MTDTEKQELENYRKCVHAIINRIWQDSAIVCSTDKLALMMDIADILKCQQFGNILEKHMPWNYKE